MLREQQKSTVDLNESVEKKKQKKRGLKGVIPLRTALFILVPLVIVSVSSSFVLANRQWTLFNSQVKTVNNASNTVIPSSTPYALVTPTPQPSTAIASSAPALKPTPEAASKALVCPSESSSNPSTNIIVEQPVNLNGTAPTGSRLLWTGGGTFSDQFSISPIWKAASPGNYILELNVTYNGITCFGNYLNLTVSCDSNKKMNAENTLSTQHQYNQTKLYSENSQAVQQIYNQYGYGTANQRERDSALAVLSAQYSAAQSQDNNNYNQQLDSVESKCFTYTD